jgi:2'-5' RNA ligase
MAAGETALIVKLPEAEPLVGPWRDRYDSSAAAGVPAHLTVLYPFLPESRLDPDVLNALDELIGAHAPFEVRFAHCGRFPDVLYLAPDPDLPFRALTEAVAARWPEAPPHGGQFDDVVPHLTVAHGQDPATYDTIEAALSSAAPVSARVTTVHLFVRDAAEHWHERRPFALGRRPRYASGAGRAVGE